MWTRAGVEWGSGSWNKVGMPIVEQDSNVGGLVVCYNEVDIAISVKIDRIYVRRFLAGRDRRCRRAKLPAPDPEKHGQRGVTGVGHDGVETPVPV
jgi:hypothetical protein